MFLNPHEEKIIGTFSNNCTPFYKTPTTLLLRWADCEILAVFLEEMEDENDPDGGIDDPEFEEFWSFLFRVKEVHGHPPVEPYNGFILVNYHNFPEEILHDGVKVN